MADREQFLKIPFQSEPGGGAESIMRGLTEEDIGQLLRSRLVFMVGGPLVGKSTVARVLTKHYDLIDMSAYWLESDRLRLALYPSNAGYGFEDSPLYRYARPRSDLLYATSRILLGGLLEHGLFEDSVFMDHFSDIKGVELEEKIAVAELASGFGNRMLQENQNYEVVIHDGSNLDTERRRKNIAWAQEVVGADNFTFILVRASETVCYERKDGKADGVQQDSSEVHLQDYDVIARYKRGFESGLYSFPTTGEGVYIIEVDNS